MNCLSLTCWLHFLQCQHRVYLTLLLPTELQRKFSFYPWKVLVSRSAHWDIHDHRVTWQHLRFAWKSFWCHFKNPEWLSCKSRNSPTWLSVLWFRTLLKMILLQCSSNYRTNSLFLTSAVCWGCTKLQISGWWHSLSCLQWGGERERREGKKRGSRNSI